MPALIILVNTDSRVLRHTEAMLSEGGYLVAALTSFAEAKKLLETVMPDLLIADIRLDAFNGLQLAVRSHLEHPDVPIIVTHTVEDPLAEAEANRQGAAFIAAPLENPSFLPQVQAALTRRRGGKLAPIRRWFRKRAPGLVEVTAGDARAQIIDMSYGGTRLAFSDSCEIPATFDITVLPAGVTVKAHPIWTGRLEADRRFQCGAELVDSGDDWQQFVDSARRK